jgi:hypothetical protein
MLIDVLPASVAKNFAIYKSIVPRDTLVMRNRRRSAPRSTTPETGTSHLYRKSVARNREKKYKHPEAPEKSARRQARSDMAFVKGDKSENQSSIL